MSVKIKIFALAAVVTLGACTPEIRNHKVNVRGKLYDMRETFQPSSFGPGGSSQYVIYADGIAFSCSISSWDCINQLEKHLDDPKALEKTKVPQPVKKVPIPTAKTTSVSRPEPPAEFEGGD